MPSFFCKLPAVGDRGSWLIALGSAELAATEFALGLFSRLVADSQAIEKASAFQEQAVESWGWVENSILPREEEKFCRSTELLLCTRLPADPANVPTFKESGRSLTGSLRTERSQIFPESLARYFLLCVSEGTWVQVLAWGEAAPKSLGA